MIIDVIVKTGQGKSSCDDAVLINDKLISNDMCTVCCHSIKSVFIADGVGGNKGGNLASQFVLNRIRETDFTNYSFDELSLFFQHLNDELILFASMTNEMKNMATTLTGLVNSNGKYYLIHVGNTRLYVKQGAYLNQISTDQTMYQSYIDRGLTEEAQNISNNIIYSCMGGGNKNYYHPYIKELYMNQLPCLLVLTSDGIHDYLSIDIIENKLINYDDITTIEEICKLSINNGSKDDISMVVIQKESRNENGTKI